MIDVDRALLRGRYAACVAVMAAIGVSIDVPFLLHRSWRAAGAQSASRRRRPLPGLLDGPASAGGRVRGLLKWLGLWGGTAVRTGK